MRAYSRPGAGVHRGASGGGARACENEATGVGG